jgi:hypothetical protein
MKLSSIIGTAAVAFACASTPASASVLFTGDAAGCFVCGSFSNSAVDAGVTYTGATFSNSTDASDNLVVNLGSFSLVGGNNTYNDPFTLEVSFTVPAGVTPNGTSSTFTAEVTGKVTGGPNANGSASVDFDNTLHTYTWSGGSFTLQVFDVSPFSVGFSNSVTGNIHVTEVAGAVPEPSTWAMMILGFAGIGFMAYRRRGQGQILRMV